MKALQVEDALGGRKRLDDARRERHEPLAIGAVCAHHIAPEEALIAHVFERGVDEARRADDLHAAAEHQAVDVAKRPLDELLREQVWQPELAPERSRLGEAREVRVGAKDARLGGPHPTERFDDDWVLDLPHEADEIRHRLHLDVTRDRDAGCHRAPFHRQLVAEYEDVLGRRARNAEQLAEARRAEEIVLARRHHA